MLTWLKGTAIATLAIFAPVRSILLSVLVLVILDSVTGVLAARKRGDKITSAGLRRTVSKLLAFEIVLIVGHLFETYLVKDLGFPVVGLLAAAIGFVEAKSCLENADTVAGTSIFRSIIQKLGSKNDLGSGKFPVQTPPKND